MNQSVALVTGASSGIGKAVAEQLAATGAKLILLARREERLKEISAKLAKQTSCHIIACDLNAHHELEAQLQQRPPEFAQIDILINNAGLALGIAPATQASWEDWQLMVQTNCLSMAKLTHLLLPDMVKHNKGHIVNIGSVAGDYAYPGGNVYGASKAFVKQFSKNLKVDLNGTKVRVTNIEPGMVGDAEFSLVRFKGDKEKAQAVYDKTQPLLPKDIAASIVWALSQPPHVNINRLEIMPVCQSEAGFQIHRED